MNSSYAENKEQSYRNCWQKRTNLERILICVAILTVLLVIGLILYILVTQTVGSNICTTPACILSAAQVLNFIDPSIDPCDDFYNFVCQSYFKKAYGVFEKSSPLYMMTKEVESQENALIKEPIYPNDHYLIKTQKLLYQSCVNETEIEKIGLEPFASLLDELGGWPVLNRTNWDENEFDWIKTVYKLRNLGLDHQIFLQTYTVSRHNITKYFVAVNWNGPRKVKDDLKDKYLEFMLDIAAVFGADKNESRAELLNVIEFNDELHQLIDSNTTDTKNETESGTLPDITTIGAVQEKLDNLNFDWLDFLNNILAPATELSNETSILFSAEEYIINLFELLERTPKRTQANFMIWVTVENYIKFLTKDLRDIKEKYDALEEQTETCVDVNLKGGKIFSKRELKRMKFCTYIAKQMVPTSPISYARKYVAGKTRAAAKEIYARLTDELKNVLQNNDWMDGETKELAIIKANNIVALIASVENYNDDTILEKICFQKDVLENDDMLTIIRKMTRNGANIEYRRIGKNKNETELLDLIRYTTQVNAFYSPMDNIILIPGAIFQGIFFDVNRLQALNYGAFGTIVGHELTHGFGKAGSKFYGKGVKKDWWSNETAEAYDSKMQCFIDQADNYEIQDTNTRMNGTNILEENIADNNGAYMAYNAYRKWVEKNGEEPKLIGLDYTPNQLFWISATSYVCLKEPIKKLEKFIELDEHPLSQFRGVSPIMNNKNFARDFNCKSGSRMNPETSCTYV